MPFHTVHGVLKARILKLFAVPFSSGPRFSRTLHHDLFILGSPTRHDACFQADGGWEIWTSSLTVEPTSVLLLKGLLPWKESLLPRAPVCPPAFPSQVLLPSETLTWSFTGTKALVRVTIRKCTRRKWASLAKELSTPHLRIFLFSTFLLPHTYF